MWIIKILVFNLSLVLASELSVSFLLGARTIRKLSTVALINVITNPLAVMLVLYLHVRIGTWPYSLILCLEILIVILEGFMFSRFQMFKEKNPYLISLLLNLVSFGIGEIINTLI